MPPLLANHDISNTAERHRGFRDHASRLDKLTAVLFEYYNYAGPVELLSVVKQLSETHHRLVILSDPDSISASSIHLADIYLAEHQLRHDLDSLELSLKYYSRALNDEKLLNCWRLQAQIGLAYANFYRFLAWDTHEDCRTAVRLIDDALGRVDEFDNDQSSRAQAIAYAVLIKASAPTRMVMSTPLEDTLNMLPSLLEALGYRLSRSLYITCLVAQARLSLYLAMTASRVEHIQEGIKAATTASQLCSEDAVFMKHFTLTSLVTLYFRARYDDKDGSNYHRDAAVEIAEGMLRMFEFMLMNAYVHCYWLHCWADAAMERAVRREHLDIMEQVVDTYKQALDICPPSHNIRRMLITNHLASLGQYFEHSGRVSVLDEGIALALRLGPDAAMNIPYLACNAAESMIMRARINDPKNARILISRAIQLCQNRVGAEGYPHDDMERISLDMQLISASRMQAQLGGDAILDIDTILRITHTGLSDSHEPALRTACILTRTEALVARARSHDDTSSLIAAQVLLDKELSSPLTASTIFSVDLLAEKANVLIAQSDLMSHISNIDRQNLLISAWDHYRRAITASVGRAQERFQASLKWAASAANRGNYLEAFQAYVFAVKLLPQVVFRGENVLGRIEALRQVSGLAASSVAMALRVEDVSASILFLEQTRGILWLQTSRGQASDLDCVPPELKERFMNVSLNLERSDRLNWATQRAEAAELDLLTAKIRELPGFERFLLPPSLQDLEQALNSSGGYAAVVVPNANQCTVLLFGVPEGHRIVQLPHMDMGKIFSLGRDFIFECSTTRASMRKMSKSPLKLAPNLESIEPTLLSELWTGLVHPVIKELAIHVSKIKRASKAALMSKVSPCRSRLGHFGHVYGGALLVP
jgi:tetratricopeptide (TPR) repeat protein